MNIEQARSSMIEQQIRPWDVFDESVLGLLASIHREDFMPEQYRELAFVDMSVPIGHKQMTMTPKVEARLLQSLALTNEDSVLEVGTGCGYLTALLANLAAHVKSIDIYPDFIHAGEEKLAQLKLNNVDLDCIDFYAFLKTASTRYDAIVLTASIPVIHTELFKLLNENGRIFAIVGESPAMEACIINKRTDTDIETNSLFEIDFPALIGANQEQKFEF